MPILLALALMAAAAMPWLRALESQRKAMFGSATTVPPPEQAAINALSAGDAQGIGNPRDASPLHPLPPSPAEQKLSTPPDQTGDGKKGNGISGGTESSRGSQPQGKTSTAEKTTDSSQSTPPKPQTLLDNAVRSVESRQFISARVKQQGELVGHQITGEGRYYELRQGPIPSIHFEVTAEIGSATTSLVQVCNGTTFWSHRKLPTWDVLYKIDAVRATAALERARSTLPHEALTSAPGLGGLGRLLRGLNSRFEFTAVVAEQLGGLPVWKLNGGWKPDQLARLLPNQKEAIANGRKPDLAHLPAHLPDSVALFLCQEDCFPFRVDYLRSLPKSSPRLLLGLEFFELNFNGPIDSGQFLFAPGSNLQIIDRTEEFVHSLGDGG